MTEGKWKITENGEYPSFMLHPSAAERPDAIIEPENSFIVEVSCAEIIKCSSDRVYQAGYTMRFPRFTCSNQHSLIL